jgi:hypothetical protein
VGDPPKRAPQRTVRVVVSATEQTAIGAMATRLGMSVSAYLRALGLGYEPRGRLDLAEVTALSAVIADQARLGNLLRLWLSDDRRLAAFEPGKAAAAIGSLMVKLDANQDAIRGIVASINRAAAPMRSRL